jgi:pre-mRNA cleavage complex 2 protein Pcf11
MVAEDHADSVTNAEAIYKVIREPLISASVHSDRKLPLVYVIDSILKNVRGKYVQIIEEDAKTWMPVVYGVLPEDKRAKLKKVWDLWKDAGVFSTENWNEMGQCFSGTANMGDGSVDNTILENAGILFGVSVTKEFVLYCTMQYSTVFMLL